VTNTDLGAFLRTRPFGTQVEWTHFGRRLRGEIAFARMTDVDVFSLELSWIAEETEAGWHVRKGARGQLILISFSGPNVARDDQVPDRWVFADLSGPVYFDLPGTGHFFPYPEPALHQGASPARGPWSCYDPYEKWQLWRGGWSCRLLGTRDCSIYPKLYLKKPLLPVL
jgi:hypothetical protein